MTNKFCYHIYIQPFRTDGNTNSQGDGRKFLGYYITSHFGSEISLKLIKYVSIQQMMPKLAPKSEFDYSL